MFKSTEVDLSDKALTQTILQAFPAVLNQEDGSVNQRLLQTIVAIVLSHKNDMLKLASMSNLDNMSGGLLTAKAADWGVSRIDDDDEFLRFQIRLAILKSQLGDSMNDLKKLISIALGIDPSFFDIVAGDEIESMKILNVPFNFDVSQNRERKKKLFEQTIQEIMPVEFKLQEIQYSTYSIAHIYVGTYTQRWRKIHAPLLLGRSMKSWHHVFVGIVARRWHITHSKILDLKE